MNSELAVPESLAPTSTENKSFDFQLAVLQGSVLVVAFCGIAYELIIGTISPYLLGNSVYQFSLTIGFFMFAMGLARTSHQIS